MAMRTVQDPVERLVAATAACADLDALAATVFRVVGSSIPFGFACFATIDPANGLVTGAVKSRALPVGDEEFAAVEYGGPDLNRFSDLAERRVPVGALGLDTGGRPEESRRFREFMAPRFGFTDELRLVCRSRGTVWAALALYREGGAPPFDVDDVRLLAALGEAIADRMRAVLVAPSEAVPPSLPAVLLLDARDRVTDRSPFADAVVADLGGWDEGGYPPTGVLAVAVRARAGDGPVVSRVRGRSSGWLSVRGLALTPTDAGVPVVLTVEPAARAAVGQIALAAHGLTGRESEIVDQVLQGRSTAAMAAALHLSPHTVQDHLKAVFDKVRVRSRRELIARFVE